jgi:hypothetical protein
MPVQQDVPTLAYLSDSLLAQCREKKIKRKRWSIKKKDKDEK